MIDGVFGWQTERAVMDFQYKFGLTVDGVAGSDTKNMLVRATPGWQSSGTQGGSAGAPAHTASYSTNDMDLLARAVYSEARGEPYEGQVAIAAVILNRLARLVSEHGIGCYLRAAGVYGCCGRTVLAYAQRTSEESGS